MGDFLKDEDFCYFQIFEDYFKNNWFLIKINKILPVFQKIKKNFQCGPRNFIGRFRENEEFFNKIQIHYINFLFDNPAQECAFYRSIYKTGKSFRTIHRKINLSEFKKELKFNWLFKL